MRIVYALLLSFIPVSLLAQPKTFYVLYFDTGKDIPTTSSQRELRAFIEELRQVTVSHITVKGYTDHSGGNGYNLTLSRCRAHAITDQLQQALPDVPVSIGYFGERDPVTTREEQQERNRRVELLLTYAQPKTRKEETLLQPFFMDVGLQTFSINLDDTVSVLGKEGTTIRIPPGSILRRDGSLMKGRAVLELKEYYEPSDILLAGLHSTSSEGLLQTGGMFRLFIIQGKDTAAVKTKKQVEIKMLAKDPTLSNMRVYTLPHGIDSAAWNNTQRAFRQTYGYWDWPRTPRLQDIFSYPEIRFENFRTGGKISDEYDISRPLIGFRGIGPWSDRYIPYAKKIAITIQKTDSVTLYVKTRIHYRRKGLKRFGVHILDTSFTVNYTRPQYVSEVSDLSFINCDRFYRENNRANFIVETPGFKGMKVLVYFKRLNAFMNAGITGDKYVFSNVPARETVYLVAFGKKDNDYYYGQQVYTIEANGKAQLAVTKTAEDDFKKRLRSLNN